jgi:uncharacterized membrane protein YphA (DoxX/SURF4 family)
MGNLSNIGRIFFGMAIAGIGIPVIYYKDLPYMLVPPKDYGIPGYLVIACGFIFILIGLCIILSIKIRPVSFYFGCVLLLIFCFLFIPYMFSASANYRHLTEWENSFKELDLAGGAFLVAGCFAGKNKNFLNRTWNWLIPFGTILFILPVINYGILHFQLAKEVSTMVPAWIPGSLFWTYFAGAALLGSGLAILLNIKTRPIAALLGLMIFIWFIILHIPRVVSTPIADDEGEITSAFLALAYSGIAFLIAGAAKKV